MSVHFGTLCRDRVGGSGSGTCVKMECKRAVVELKAEVIVKQWHERGGEESGLT